MIITSTAPSISESEAEEPDVDRLGFEPVEPPDGEHEQSRGDDRERHCQRLEDGHGPDTEQCEHGEEPDHDPDRPEPAPR